MFKCLPCLKYKKNRAFQKLDILMPKLRFKVFMHQQYLKPIFMVKLKNVSFRLVDDFTHYPPLRIITTCVHLLVGNNRSFPKKP